VCVCVDTQLFHCVLLCGVISGSPPAPARLFACCWVSLLTSPFSLFFCTHSRDADENWNSLFVSPSPLDYTANPPSSFSSRWFGAPSAAELNSCVNPHSSSSQPRLSFRGPRNFPHDYFFKFIVDCRHSSTSLPLSLSLSLLLTRKAGERHIVPASQKQAPRKGTSS
jgi:hypothetical protein